MFKNRCHTKICYVKNLEYELKWSGEDMGTEIVGGWWNKT